MEIKVLKEAGYEEAALGFSLSYNSTLERAKELLPIYAFKAAGETKFLESISIWLDVTAPRFWWQEADTYRVGSTKQSESTMHTICKEPLTPNSFEDLGGWHYDYINIMLGVLNKLVQEKNFYELKVLLPESFLQRRIWCINYKTLQNIYNQRKNHRLPQWKNFCNEILTQIEHPEFLVKEYHG
jgi:hypothetical protein